MLFSKKPLIALTKYPVRKYYMIMSRAAGTQRPTRLPGGDGLPMLLPHNLLSRFSLYGARAAAGKRGDVGVAALLI
jgi:hypothetical protein